MIKKYIKKPIPVEAVQWRGSDAYTDNQRKWLFDSGSVRFGGIRPPKLLIYTIEGVMKAHVGDYIVKGVDGEFYPVKKEIFEKTYVEAKEDEEFVSVRKDRLENLIEHSYETSCPLVNSSACHLDRPDFMCSDCEFNYGYFDDDSEPPVKNVIKWLEGKEND